MPICKSDNKIYLNIKLICSCTSQDQFLTHHNFFNYSSAIVFGEYIIPMEPKPLSECPRTLFTSEYCPPGQYSPVNNVPPRVCVSVMTVPQVCVFVNLCRKTTVPHLKLFITHCYSTRSYDSVIHYANGMYTTLVCY